MGVEQNFWISQRSEIWLHHHLIYFIKARMPHDGVLISESEGAAQNLCGRIEGISCSPYVAQIDGTEDLEIHVHFSHDV